MASVRGKLTDYPSPLLGGNSVVVQLGPFLGSELVSPCNAILQIQQPVQGLLI